MGLGAQVRSSRTGSGCVQCKAGGGGVMLEGDTLGWVGSPAPWPRVPCASPGQWCWMPRRQGRPLICRWSRFVDTAICKAAPPWPQFCALGTSRISPSLCEKQLLREVAVPGMDLSSGLSP